MTKSAFRFLFGCALCLFGSGYAFAAPIAYVHNLTGNLAVQYGSGAPQDLKIGSTIEPGAVLSTGAGSTAVVKFEDGQLTVLQENTSFAVRKYDYIKTNVAKSSAVFELLKGGLRFITGVIGATNHDAVKLSAGTATIGIRGTDTTVILDAIANIVTAAVNAGAIVLDTPLGSIGIPAGSFSTGTPNLAPTPASPIAQATPIITAILAAAARVDIPINTPVVVEASAQAAVDQAAARDAAVAAAADPTNADLQQAAASAQQAADTSLQTAIQAATQAYQQAVQGGGQQSSPPATTPGGQSGIDPTTGLPAAGAGDQGTTGTPGTGSTGTGGGGTASPS